VAESIGHTVRIEATSDARSPVRGPDVAEGPASFSMRSASGTVDSIEEGAWGEHRGVRIGQGNEIVVPGDKVVRVGGTCERYEIIVVRVA